MKMPTTPGGLRKYDDLPAPVAAWAAWNVTGLHPAAHDVARRVVRDAAPLLARALDRLHDDDGQSRNAYENGYDHGKLDTFEQAWTDAEAAYAKTYEAAGYRFDTALVEFGAAILTVFTPSGRRRAKAAALTEVADMIRDGHQKIPGLLPHEFNTGGDDLTTWHEVEEMLRDLAAKAGKS